MGKYILVLILVSLVGAMIAQASENMSDKKTYPVVWNQSGEQAKTYPVVWPGSEKQMPEKIAEPVGEQNKSSVQNPVQPFVFLNLTMSSTTFNNTTVNNNFAAEKPEPKPALTVPQGPLPVPRLWGVIEHGPGGMAIIRG